MIRALPLTALLAGCPAPVPPATPEPAVEPTPAPAPTPVDEPVATQVRVDRVDADALRALLASPSRGLRIVNFWATWCGPCKAEMPALGAFARARPDIELMFVNLDHPKAVDKRLARFIQEQKIQDFRHLRPSLDEPELTDAIPDWPDVLPVTLVLEPSGTVRRRVVGAVDEATLHELVGDPVGQPAP